MFHARDRICVATNIGNEFFGECHVVPLYVEGKVTSPQPLSVGVERIAAENLLAGPQSVL